MWLRGVHGVDAGKDDRCGEEHADAPPGDQAGGAGDDGDAGESDESDQWYEGRRGGHRQPAETIGAGGFFFASIPCS